ncbi:MAG: hypothetical protein V4633_16120 [Pseudomonadota bacterium]
MIKTRDFFNIVAFPFQVGPVNTGAAGTHLTSFAGVCTCPSADFMLMHLKKAYNSGF